MLLGAMARQLAAILWACAVAGCSGDIAVEPFARRACKFGPLPASLDDGYRRSDGSAYIGDVFGLPAVALARGGHNITGSAVAGSMLGLAVQVPFATSAVISVLLIQGEEVRKCRPTWGAGGRHKQCVLERAQLRDGPFIVSFRVAGLGEALHSTEGLANPSACILLRVDLQIGSLRLDRPQCSQIVPLPSTPMSASAPVRLSSFRMAIRSGGVVWSSPIQRSGDLNQMQVLFARLVFPFLAQPMQLLLEEVDCGSRFDRPVPLCALRCYSGTTETQMGQVMERSLAPSSCYVLWVLATENQDTCVEFEFESSLTLHGVSRLQYQYLGPPAWLCDGASWPALLEQSREEQGQTPVRLQELDRDAPAVIRARRFRLHDIFELTRLPAQRTDQWSPTNLASSPAYGGLHALQIVVSFRSRLRLSTHAATVPVRPVLVRGTPEDAMSQRTGRVPTSRIPAAGGELWHGIHTDLEPGTYSLVFVVDHPAGGLRPCSTVLLRLELAPVDDLQEARMGTGTVQPGACPIDLPKSFLQEQLSRALLPSDNYFDRSEDFQVTLPRSLPHIDDDSWATWDVALLANGYLHMSASEKTPVLLRIKVTSQYLGADFHVQVYFEGVPVAEPKLAADGSGYLSIVGPMSRSGTYHVVMFHVPNGRYGRQDPQCATFSLDISSVLAAPASLGGAAVAPSVLLPGGSICRMTASELPTQLSIAPGRPALVDGEFVLPAKGRIDIEMSNLQGPFVLHAIASSIDAEVRLVASSGYVSAPGLLGLSEDRVIFHGDTRATLTLLAARLPTQSVCPTLHLHLVVLHHTEIPLCPWPSSNRQDSRNSNIIQKDLETALAGQPVETAQLRVFTSLVPAVGLDAVAVFDVQPPTAELRIDFSLEQMWAPFEATIQGLRGKSWGRVLARGRAAGQRLVIRSPGLPRGRYRLRLRTWTSGVHDSFKMFDADGPRCSYLTYSIALLDSSGKDTANYRQEMLNNPELIAVAPVPLSLTPRWLKPGDDFVRSQMYRVPARGFKTSLIVSEPSLFRILAEPANILTPHLDVEVTLGTENIMSGSQLMGSISVQLNKAGNYTVNLMPQCPNCMLNADATSERKSAQDLPFVFTLGLTSHQSVASWASTEDGKGCKDETPVVEVGTPPQGADAMHFWHRSQIVRVAGVREMTVPLKISHPSVVLFGAWSGFTNRYVRIGLKTEEGLWVGEQRNYRSGLEAELPPGEYSLQISEPTPPWEEIGRCTVFGLTVTISGFSMPIPPGGKLSAHNAPLGLGTSGARAVGALQARGLGARCDALGASPLPLDAYSNTGGSHCFGGPADSSGRLLMRHRMLLTDIHDGRKKMFMKPPYGSLMRVVVASIDAPEVEVVVESAQHSALSPDDVWPHSSGGWSLSYVFEGWADGAWISLHREHRDSLASGCAAFDLLVQVALLADVPQMMACPGSGSMSASEFVRKAKQHGSAVEYVNSDAFSETLAVDLPVASLVEVEVQYNLLLSDIDIRLQDAEPQLQVGAENGAVNIEDSQLNMHSVLRLRLDPGSYKVIIQHVSALPAKQAHGPCVPLGLGFRQMPWGGDTNTVMTSYSIDPSVPLSYGSDLVVAAVRSSPASRDVPTVARMEPTGMADVVDGTVAIWDQDSLLAGRDSQQSRDWMPSDQKFRALPLESDDPQSANVDILMPASYPPPESRPGKAPWAGERKPLPSFKVLVPGGPKRDSAASMIQSPRVQRAEKAVGVLRAERQTDFGNSAVLTPPPGITNPGYSGSPGSRSNFLEVVCWLVIVSLAAYAGRHTLTSIITDMFQNWKEGTWSLSGFEPSRQSREMYSMVEVTSRATRRGGYGTVEA